MAPITAAERQRKRREKLKIEGNYDEYKKKHCLQMKKYRKQMEVKTSKLPKSIQIKAKLLQKKNLRERVARCRQNKKIKEKAGTSVDPSLQIYGNTSALGKAVARARRALPNSPRHKGVVVRKLFSSECNVKLENAFNTPTLPKKEHASSLCSNLKDKIQAFYERDDISRTAPGRKDVVIIWEDGTKNKKQARHLICTMKEAFHMFKVENPAAEIGKSKFFELRPKHILLSSKLPHNVCLCIYHENFIQGINALHKYNDSVPIYSFALPHEMICKSSSRSCWLNECHVCKDANGFYAAFPQPEVDTADVNWQYWKKNQSDGHLLKVEGNGTYMDAFNYVAGMVPVFLEHCFVKRQQANSYKIMHESVLSDNFSKDLCVMQVDFSENYTCVQQDEVQSAHWMQTQVSLFTAALYHTGTLHSMVIASDVLDHSKNTVVCYISRLLEDIPKTIKMVHIWSDGPSSQFKNKYIVSSLSSLEERHGVQIQWNYFATSHGKGPVDGIGGTIKRLVFHQVKTRSSRVTDAVTFVNAAKKSGTKIKLIHLTDREIFEKNSSMNLKSIWEQAPFIQGIKKFHCIRVRDDNPEGFLITADAIACSDAISCNDTSDVTVECGDWWEIEYDGKLYPGRIERVMNGDYEVNTMEPLGRNWRWPEIEDKIFYERSKLIRKLTPPNVINSRGHFSF